MNNFTLAQIQRLIADPAIRVPTGDAFLDNRHNTAPHLYYRLFYHLARLLRPGLVVELGGWQGTAAAHFAAGWKKAIVVTIDHHTDLGDEVHKEKMMETAREYKNLVYLQGWTWNLAESVRSFGLIDVLFIDSWHDYEHAMRDWDAYRPLLSTTALVICDDITTDRGPVIDRMDQFWNELLGQKFLSKKVHEQYPMGFLKWILS